MFDADERQAALEPPSLKLNGKEYVGRCLSLDEGAALRPEFERIKGAVDEPVLADVTKKVFAALGFAASVADELLATKPYGIIVSVLADFSGALLGVKVRESARSTPESA